MNVLALDLGTKCGFAMLTQKKAGPLFDSGVWNLAPSRFSSAGTRFTKFKQQLLGVLDAYEFDLLVFEEVRAHVAVDAAHIYGGLLAVMQVVALEKGLEYQGVPVGTIKKHATGNGHAKKPEMIKAANVFYRSVDVKDDNHADALCLLNYALNKLIC